MQTHSLEISTKPTNCSSHDLIEVHDTRHHESTQYDESKIPKIIRLASISRCMTLEYSRNLDRWRFDDHELRLYDDKAIDGILGKDWSAYFPRLNEALKCLPHEGISSPSKADMWRYLILWSEGGIYTDIDNAPGRLFQNGLDGNMTEMDGLIALNQHFKPGQSFIAIRPHHPLMFLCLRLATERLLAIENLAGQNTWKVTGPSVLHAAFSEFIGDKRDGPISSGLYSITISLSNKLQSQFPGETWMKNRTISIVGSGEDSSEYVRTSVIRGYEKKKFYEMVGMMKWQGNQMHKSTLSCHAWLERTMKNSSTVVL